VRNSRVLQTALGTRATKMIWTPWLRQDYLKNRHEYDKLIEENKEVVARMAMLRENNYPITDKQICYIYLDESYVNRLEYL